MTDMTPLRIPESSWEALVISFQYSSIWAKLSLGSVLIYSIIIPLIWFVGLNIAYSLTFSMIWLGVVIFFTYKDRRLRTQEYEKRILEEESGIDIQVESKNILNLFTMGKINEEEFNSRMANVFMAIESGRGYIPAALSGVAHKTIH